MKKTLEITSLILIGTIVNIAHPLTDLRIISETKNSIVIEYTPRINTENVFGDDGSIFTRFRFFESQIEYDSTGRAGFFRPVRLILPSSGYTINVIENESYTRDSIKLLPKPTIKHIKDFGVSESYNNAEYSKINSLPEEKKIADIIQCGETSDGFIGSLILRPVQNINREKFKIYTRMVVRIDFKNALPDGVFSSSLLTGKMNPKKNQAKPDGSLEKQLKSEDSPLSQGEWYRIAIDNPGMYKLDYTFFTGLNIVINNINTVRLFGNGGIAIPDSPDTITYPRPNTLVEIPRLVIDKNSNGILDPEDCIIFYGCGVGNWKYKGGGAFDHILHPYALHNYYFFTYDQGEGRSMDSISGSIINTPVSQPSNFQEKIFSESEKLNLANSGRMWVGKLFFGVDNTDTYYYPLPGLDASAQINYKFTLYHRSATLDYLYLYENGQQLRSPVPMLNTGIGESDPYAIKVTTTATRTGGVPNNSSVIRIQVTGNNQDAKTWLDWLEIYYRRKLEALNDSLLFTTDDIAGPVNYTVSNFSSGIMVFDVSKHDSVRKITEITIDPLNTGTCTFQLQQTGGQVRRIAVVGNSGYKYVAGAVKISNTMNLHNAQNQYDFIIISPAEFISEANRLKSHRDSDTSQGGLTTVVVNIDHIYNEFSGGLLDPLAIREFLMYAQRYWRNPKPKYVLLFGWGHYDYKNLSTSQNNWIPPYETVESLQLEDSYPCDDQFVMFSSAGNSCSMAIGRLPARNLTEAAICVNKIISYETSVPVDPWRNRITFVADDGKTSTADDGRVYTNDTETLAEDPDYTPNRFEKNKIYIVQYPTVNSSAGRRKPDANKAITNAINAGTLITNFIGHGNLRQWAHETIFTKEDDVPKLYNKDRLTFVVASTCSYGWYDNPNEISASEQLVTMEKGGAIAVASAARVVYNTPNVSLNKSLYNYLLHKNVSGQFRRLGDAWQNAKNDNYASGYYKSNFQKFHLFGDPTLKISIPKQDVTVDSVEGASPKNSSVAIKSLDYVNIVGTARWGDGTPMTEFSGTGIIRLFDSEKRIVIQDGDGDLYKFIFDVSGSQLYGGEVSVNNGNYRAVIPIPKDVTFGKNARISIYIWGNQTDGSGYTENVIIDGIDTTAVIDTAGPRISIYLDDLAFHSGDVLKNNPVLIVQLEDESGINTSAVGIGHQLSATISNPERIIDLSNYYRSSRDTYRSGEARYQLNDLNNGRYVLKIKAWDIQNNSSEAETFFEVSSNSNLEMLNVFNYPNPFSNSTNFTFQRNSIDPIDIEVKIYTIAGRLIGNISMNTMERSVFIPWDGRDNEGAPLANGVYFYKIIVHNQITQKTCESIGKMAVIR